MTSALSLLSAFADPRCRLEAAREMARWLGVEHFLLLVLDPEIRVLLPAPGFPQRVAGGPVWRAFLRTAVDPGTHRADVDYPRSDPSPAIAYTSAGGLSIVLVGGSPDEHRVDEVRAGAPLLGALLVAEHRQRVAEGQAAVEREAGIRVHELAIALDRTRSDLERALAESARLNAELKELDQRKDEFLAMLGHELRNPLAAIAGAVEVARIRPDDRAHHSRALAIVSRHAAQLARLVDDLLDVSRVSRGKITLRPARVRVEGVVARALEATRGLVAEHGHEVSVDTDPALHVNADPARLEQMITNLLTNAAKYTADGGHIRVVATRDDGTAIIRVEDDGVGIDPTMLPHVFEPFVQVARSVDRSAGGLGVGLTLVRRLAELHGGSVSAESEPGRGSVFVIRLAAVDAPPSDDVPVPVAARRGTSKRVLVVDDNIDSGEMMAELAASWGHHAVHVGDGSRALELAEEMRPDLVLLDIGLPGMDGYEVAARLRRQPGTRGARIVAVSGYGQAEDKRKSRAAGIDDHLVKPVDVDTLARVIGST